MRVIIQASGSVNNQVSSISEKILSSLNFMFSIHPGSKLIIITGHLDYHLNLGSFPGIPELVFEKLDHQREGRLTMIINLHPLMPSM